MKNRKITLALASLFFVSAMMVTSCKKHKAEDIDTDTTETSDQSLAENSANDIINIGSQATDNSAGNLTAGKTMASEDALAYCATVKHDYTHKIDTVIFDNSSCLDGRMRSGMLIFDHSASAIGAEHYRDPGFKCTVTSVNYSVEGNKINIINKTIENTTPQDFNPATTNLTWLITGHIQVVKANGTHDFTFTRVKTLLNTSDNNVYHGAPTAISWGLAKIGLTGSASGTTVKGRTYTCNITSQLIRDLGGCLIGKKHPFIQGTLDFTPGSLATRTLDFGNGSCDLDATVTINGVSHAITLP